MLAFSRSYNSLNPTDGPFGYGWSASGFTQLQLDGSDALRVKQASGRSEPWRLVDGAWQGDGDTRLRLHAEGDGYRLHNPDLSVERYNSAGRLTQRADANGLTRTYGYDTAGRLTRITAPFGRQLQLRYNSAERVAAIVTPDGEITYAYDDQGNLSQVRYPDATTRSYHYENERLPHHLTGITDERGVRYATWHYQSDGRVTRSEHADGAERVRFVYSGSNTTQAIGALGDERYYRHKTIHGVRRITSVAGEPCTTCGNGGLKQRRYDDDGFLIGYTDWNDNETRLTPGPADKQLARHTRSLLSSYQPPGRGYQGH
jgi:YD repeat-containing protein